MHHKKLLVNNYYYIDNEDVRHYQELTVKVRYRLQLTPCKINILDEQRVEVELLKPEAIIANVQTTVFYVGNRLIGGGFIEDSF